MKLGILPLVKPDAVASDVDEKVAPMGQAVIHLGQCVYDEIDRRAQRLGDRQFAVEPVLGGRPDFDPVGQLVVVADDEKIEIRLIGLGCVRFIDPAAMRIAPVEDNLEDARLLLPIGSRDRLRVAELLEVDLDDTLQLALFGRGANDRAGTLNDQVWAHYCRSASSIPTAASARSRRSRRLIGTTGSGRELPAVSCRSKPETLMVQILIDRFGSF